MSNVDGGSPESAQSLTVILASLVLAVSFPILVGRCSVALSV